MDNNYDENIIFLGLDDVTETYSTDGDDIYIEIKIGDKGFTVGLNDNECDNEFSKYHNLCDNQHGSVYAITALKKLVKFLELSLDIGISEDLCK